MTEDEAFIRAMRGEPLWDDDLPDSLRGLGLPNWLRNWTDLLAQPNPFTRLPEEPQP